MAKMDIEKMAQNVAEKAIQNLRDNGVFVSSWIPVSERLPKESGYYLVNVYIEDCCFSEVSICWFAHSDDYSITAGEWRECADDELVTAWMPLPEPYKAESEG